MTKPATIVCESTSECSQAGGTCQSEGTCDAGSDPALCTGDGCTCCIGEKYICTNINLHYDRNVHIFTYMYVKVHAHKKQMPDKND